MADASRVVLAKMLAPVFSGFALGKTDESAWPLIGKTPPNNEIKSTVARTWRLRVSLPAVPFVNSSADFRNQFWKGSTFATLSRRAHHKDVCELIFVIRHPPESAEDVGTQLLKGKCRINFSQASVA